MPYNQNDPNYQTKNSRISSFNDFNLNIDKEKAELKKMKMSTIKNDSELHRIPGNRKFKFNKVTHKIDDISPDEINDKLIRILNQFAPHGPHNMTPVFCSRNVMDTGYARVVGDNHLKLELYQPNTKLTKIEAMAFNKGDFLHFFKKQTPIDIVYKIKVNEYRGVSNIQLIIEDIKLA